MFHEIFLGAGGVHKTFEKRRRFMPKMMDGSAYLKGVYNGLERSKEKKRAATLLEARGHEDQSPWDKTWNFIHQWSW